VVDYSSVRSPLLIFISVVLLVGCSRKDSATDRPTASTAAPAASSSSPPSSSSTPSSSSSASSTTTTDAPKTAAEIAKDAKPPLEASLEAPVVRIKTKQGALVVWSTTEGEANSLVLAAYEKKPGELLQPAKILRKTSGQVQAVAAVVTEGGSEDVAVAWTSGLLEGKGQLNALVFASPDLAKVTAPTTLGIVNAPIQLQAHVGLIKRPASAGGGVVAAHQGPGTSCKLMDQPTDCLTFDVKAVSPDGKVEKLGSTKLHGGPSPEYFFADLKERGLIVYGSSMRGGRTIAPVVVAWSAKDPAPAFESPPECGGQAAFAPDFAKGTKDEVVSLCIDVPPEKGPACAKPLTGEKARCLHIAASSSSAEGGKSLTGQGKWDIPVTKVECIDGKPKLTFPSGELTLTSSTPNLGDFVKKCGGPQ
jgi:hypothetical protein